MIYRDRRYNDKRNNTNQLSSYVSWQRKICWLSRFGGAKNHRWVDRIMGSEFSLADLHLFYFPWVQAAQAGFNLLIYVCVWVWVCVCVCVFKCVCAGCWPGVCASRCPCWPVGWGCSSRTFADGRRWAGLWTAWPVAGSRQPSCHSAAPPTGSALQRQQQNHQQLLTWRGKKLIIHSWSIFSRYLYFLLLLHLSLTICYFFGYFID